MISLEHIGIAVDDVNAVRDLYETLLGIVPYKAETVEAQKVRTHFLNAGTAKLELLEALGPDSPVAKYLKTRGEGLHHLAFEVPDADAALARCRDAGLRPLSDAPSGGADGKRIFFLHPKDTHGVLVEFCESMPTAWTPETIDGPNGDALAAYRAGTPANPPVLLLHGAAGCTQAETTPLMRRLEPSFHVLAVDFAGHGASALPDEPFTADRFAEDARAALDHFGVDAAHVFGFSMGGNMALHLARRHPNRVGRVAVHGANVDWTEATMQKMLARLNVEAIRERSPRVATQLDGLHRDWAALFGGIQDFVRQLPARSAEMLEMVGTLTHPTLVSAVDRDDLFDLETALTLHRHLPNARLAIVPGTRHALPEAPLDRVAAELTDHFLGRHG